MPVKNATKSEFIRTLSADGALWIYVWCGDTDRYDIDYVADALDEKIEEARRDNLILDTRSYTHTSGYRVVSNTGSILDLSKHERVHEFDNGYIVENNYSRWAYVRAA